MEIKYVEKLNDELGKMIDDEFEKYARKHGVVCGYKPFTFIAEEDGKTIGIITGCTYYKEVHIGDLIIVEEYRNRHIGSKLIETVESIPELRKSIKIGETNAFGTGGMETKIQAAEKVTEYGIEMLLANGGKTKALTGLLEENAKGTLFSAE